MPDLTAGQPLEIWDTFFRQHRPVPALVRGWVLRLHNQKQHKQVIACLQTALTQGQAQPWMYEVLALSMEIENYPKESVERVVLSLSDFGQADYESMMYSGAYLARFGRKVAALRMYQQASRMLPERHEPYVLGLKLAQDVGTPDAVLWAASGLLLNSWGSDYQAQHRRAEDAVLEQVRQLQKRGDETQAAQLQQALSEAQSRDLTIRLEWNGDADLDLLVEEPSGSVCSVESPISQGGGLHLHDGVGPDRQNAYELYVCPRGMAGPYRVVVRNVMGTVVGNRAVLMVTIREGLSDQEKFERTLLLEEAETALTVDLQRGRRSQLRVVTAATAREAADDFLIRSIPLSPNSAQRDPRAAEVAGEFVESRLESASRNGGRRAGAVGYAPVVQVIPQGTSLTAQGIISADRRYVRIGVEPVFSDITDVFTFSFLNSGNAQTGQNRP